MRKVRETEHMWRGKDSPFSSETGGTINHCNRSIFLQATYVVISVCEAVGLTPCFHFRMMPLKTTKLTLSPFHKSRILYYPQPLLPNALVN